MSWWEKGEQCLSLLSQAGINKVGADELCTMVPGQKSRKKVWAHHLHTNGTHMDLQFPTSCVHMKVLVFSTAISSETFRVPAGAYRLLAHRGTKNCKERSTI